MVQNVFNSYEKKYLLSKEQYEALRRRMAPYMEEDAYGLHTIRNIYYDTDTDELIRTSLDKPQYKEKFRVRCYGTPKEDSPIFLEIKKKYRGLVNKRRAVLSQKEARAYLEQGVRPMKYTQILKEIDYFLHSHNAVPKVYLAYDRVALFGKEDAEFRVTFDTNIRYRNDDLKLENDSDTTMLQGRGFYLMEVKILNAMPLWFAHLLDEMEIRSISFSKYGTAYKKNLQNGYYSYVDERSVRVC